MLHGARNDAVLLGRSHDDVAQAGPVCEGPRLLGRLPGGFGASLRLYRRAGGREPGVGPSGLALKYPANRSTPQWYIALLGGTAALGAHILRLDLPNIIFNWHHDQDTRKARPYLYISRVEAVRDLHSPRSIPLNPERGSPIANALVFPAFIVSRAGFVVARQNCATTTTLCNERKLIHPRGLIAYHRAG